jgi:hypothetical protein
MKKVKVQLKELVITNSRIFSRLSKRKKSLGLVTSMISHKRAKL